MKVIAVVVTYNRCELLKKAIYALKSQSHQLDTILVINNGSTDGTKQWLEKQEGLLVITQENLGGSGGFWRGIKEAYNLGADYIWCMDDDVHPYDDCLEQLLKVMLAKGGIVAPKRLLDGKSIVLGGECLHFNFYNPFKALKNNANLADLANKETLSVEAIAFEGPLISRTVIDKIGFPEKDLFIFWDDTEYSYRAFINGFSIMFAPKAHLYKENLGTKYSISKYRSWKYPYMLRNEIFFIHRYSTFPIRVILELKVFLYYLLGLYKHLILCDGKYKFCDIKLLLKSFYDGKRGKLGRY